MSSKVWIALGLTVFAGMATGIGSAIAFFAKRTNYRFLSIATGFSAGVMLYVSFVEILVKGREEFASAMSGTRAEWYTIFAFFGGIGVIALIDALVPSAENPHELHAKSEVEPLHNPDAPMPDFKKLEQMEAEGQGHAPELHVHKHKLMRMGLFTALAIGIHNFPEGLATFLAALKDPALGVPIAIAIALHNIPEGISVSVPIFYATGHRGKAFFWSVMSGLSEPIGAMIAFLVIGLFVEGGLSADPPAGLMGTLFAGVAGVMVYISLDELLPTSRAYGKGHDSLIGLLAGMAVMALSLVMM